MRADLLTTAAARRGADAPRLVNLIRDDVDWIVMKCLEKDRTRRYETANGLARDVARFLNDEPVEASPPSATYRMRKFAQKYRKPLRVVVAIALILVGSSVFSIWQAARATRAEHEQRRLAESESQHRAEAEEQRTFATTAAARERDAAEQAQHSRDSAVQAKLGAILQLADNYTARGLESANSRLNARSALWRTYKRDYPDLREFPLDK